MSNLNIIQATVPAQGPMFQRLPNEILLYIFKIAMAVGSDQDQVDVIKKGDFKIMLPFTIIKTASVSEHFKDLAFQAFYEANKFAFFNVGISGKTLWSTSMPPAMPPLAMRQFLRRIQIDFGLEDWYTPAQAGGVNAPLSRTPRAHTPITNVTEWMRNVPAARSLAALTNATTGFSSLGSLELHLELNLRGCQVAFLAMFRAAAFAVRAGSVSVTFGTRQRISAQWLSSVDRAIARV
ncbi:hypothetical protein CC86DRAFT_47247 [Ophiobolus disseminans]|uniref:Uncharacterized protein n=1 Tax=Ophiobolus disseminans TaxID=1469910 RepID=A0A6A6ZW72_9PLEO|nr:hypothetical protein CC86DRAFT_47247 [Ophiobolus disseminans]